MSVGVGHFWDTLRIIAMFFYCIYSTFYVIAKEIRQQKLDQSIGSQGDIDGKHMDTTLSYVVWESPPAEPEKVHSNYHLGLFDMNRWYQLQMPESVG